MPEPLDYIRDGAEIYRRSFATIRAEANLARFRGLEEKVAVRIIHACGMVEIADDIDMSADFAEKARSALLAGAPNPVRLQDGRARDHPKPSARGQHDNLYA